MQTVLKPGVKRLPVKYVEMFNKYRSNRLLQQLRIDYLPKHFCCSWKKFKIHLL